MHTWVRLFIQAYDFAQVLASLEGIDEEVPPFAKMFESFSRAIGYLGHVRHIL